MISRFVVVLDADVLVPILSCDLLLSAFDHDLYQPVVTPGILSELEPSLLVDFAHLDRDALPRLPCPSLITSIPTRQTPTP